MAKQNQQNFSPIEDDNVYLKKLFTPENVVGLEEINVVDMRKFFGELKDWVRDDSSRYPNWCILFIANSPNNRKINVGYIFKKFWIRFKGIASMILNPLGSIYYINIPYIYLFKGLPINIGFEWSKVLINFFKYAN